MFAKRKMAISKISALYRIETYTATYSLNAGANLWITKTNFGMTAISGWKPVALLCCAAGDDAVLIRTFNLTINNVLNLRNVGTVNKSNLTATLIVLYLPE